MGCSLSSRTDSKKKKAQTVTNSLQQQLIDERLKTRFSRSEIIEWYRVVMKKSGSSYATALSLTGCIHKLLFIDYFNQLHPHGDVIRLAENFFRTYDLNGDSTIDFMEFMHAISIIRRGDLIEKLSLIFSLLDSTQEGYIDRFKLVKMMEALYNVKGINYRDNYNVLIRKVDNFIARLDQSREGQIERYKFIESCMNDPVLQNIVSVYK